MATNTSHKYKCNLENDPIQEKYKRLTNACELESSEESFCSATDSEYMKYRPKVNY